MPKVTRNVFVTENKHRVCFFFNFPDYQRLKKLASKGRRPIQMTDGQTLPTPNQVIGRLMARRLTGPFVLESLLGGASQRVMVSATQDVAALSGIPGMSALQRSPTQPCGSAASKTVDMEQHLAWAREVGLIRKPST